MEKLLSISLSLTMLMSSPVLAGNQVLNNSYPNNVDIKLESQTLNLSPPTEILPDIYVCGDWSGTEDYYYIPYILKPGRNWILINSETPFLLEYYTVNGELLRVEDPIYTDVGNLYIFSNHFRTLDYYYLRIVNLSEETSLGAIYYVSSQEFINE